MTDSQRIERLERALRVLVEELQMPLENRYTHWNVTEILREGETPPLKCGICHKSFALGESAFIVPSGLVHEACRADQIQATAP